MSQRVVARSEVTESVSVPIREFRETGLTKLDDVPVSDDLCDGLFLQIREILKVFVGIVSEDR